ncbi:hypothetical protein F4777DRAFT_153586 [Nemania sp. FL0916]|nr:hypothetical protein F4777DRAFT_153586 [Nemania sp. FL0916]
MRLSVSTQNYYSTPHNLGIPRTNPFFALNRHKQACWRAQPASNAFLTANRLQLYLWFNCNLLQSIAKVIDCAASKTTVCCDLLQQPAKLARAFVASLCESSLRACASLRCQPVRAFVADLRCRPALQARASLRCKPPLPALPAFATSLRCEASAEASAEHYTTACSKPSSQASAEPYVASRSKPPPCHILQTARNLCQPSLQTCVTSLCQPSLQACVTSLCQPSLQACAASLREPSLRSLRRQPVLPFAAGLRYEPPPNTTLQNLCESSLQALNSSQDRLATKTCAKACTSWQRRLAQARNAGSRKTSTGFATKALQPRLAAKASGSL